MTVFSKVMQASVPLAVGMKVGVVDDLPATSQVQVQATRGRGGGIGGSFGPLASDDSNEASTVGESSVESSIDAEEMARRMTAMRRPTDADRRAAQRRGVATGRRGGNPSVVSGLMRADSGRGGWTEVGHDGRPISPPPRREGVDVLPSSSGEEEDFAFAGRGLGLASDDLSEISLDGGREEGGLVSNSESQRDDAEEESVGDDEAVVGGGGRRAVGAVEAHVEVNTGNPVLDIMANLLRKVTTQLDTFSQAAVSFVEQAEAAQTALEEKLVALEAAIDAADRGDPEEVARLQRELAAAREHAGRVPALLGAGRGELDGAEDRTAAIQARLDEATAALAAKDTEREEALARKDAERDALREAMAERQAAAIAAKETELEALRAQMAGRGDAVAREMQALHAANEERTAAAVAAAVEEATGPLRTRIEELEAELAPLREAKAAAEARADAAEALVVEKDAEITRLRAEIERLTAANGAYEAQVTALRASADEKEVQDNAFLAKARQIQEQVEAGLAQSQERQAALKENMSAINARATASDQTLQRLAGKLRA